jgi:F-box domain
MSLLLQKLSIELLHDIILLLPPRDIRACRQTCKWFSRLIGDSSLLQYTLLRENSCIVDAPSTDMPMKCRIEALQRWERAWEVLRIRTLVRNIPSEGMNFLTVRICDGYLIGMQMHRGCITGYYYLSIHDPTLSSPQGDVNWTSVKFQPYGVPPTACVFATEHNMTAIVYVS